jgi:heme oxygenase
MLRRATRAQHDRIDALMDLRRMQDREHYARVLRVFDGFLAAWEPAVAAALPAWQAWLAPRSRRPFLRQDLRHLGAAPGEPARVPALASAAAAWGSVYVMEGSALGGQFITRSLAQAGLHASSGAAYFHGWGDATGAMWREARSVLAGQLDSPAAVADACEAARETFDTLSCLLEDCLHERTPAA